MRIYLLAIGALPALCLAQVSGDCSKPFEAALPAGRQITMDIRPGDMDIAGAPTGKLRVTCRFDDPAQAAVVRISFNAGHLRIYGGGSNDHAHFRIQVPDRTNLLVRSPAGDMRISGITGDKDVELKAGNLTIALGTPGAYRVVDGSVWAGDLRAEAFGVTKDGLFRSFHKDNPKGQYRLRAKLMAGDLTLQ